ncbi:MAG TPA: acyl-CoA dehydrogenase, partial [Idiomarina abyssalis]|nr:acyl-CoA dehydrogenase [Idiomarina abyssalis]
MNFELTEDQQAFVDTAKAFADKELAPNAAKWDEEHHFPIEVFRKAGEMGFMGMYTPEEAGGFGMSRLDSALIFEQLAGGCTATTAMMTIHNMVTWMIGSFGQQSVIDQWVPELVTGEKLGSYCLTEPGSGSDAASLRTSAKKDGDEYVLNGSKMFISGAGETDVL